MLQDELPLPLDERLIPPEIAGLLEPEVFPDIVREQGSLIIDFPVPEKMKEGAFLEIFLMPDKVLADNFLRGYMGLRERDFRDRFLYSGDGSIPIKSRTIASNGLYYQSNPKHTPGQPGYRQNAGIEPFNSLELFENAIPSSKKPEQMYAFDRKTNTLHRFFNDGNNTWHWSGSTNQGENSLRGAQVPNDIKNIFGLPKKGW